MRLSSIASIVAVLLLSSVGAQAQLDAGTMGKEDVAHNSPDYSPFVDRHVPDRVL